MTLPNGSAPHRVVAVGECMLELRHVSPLELRLGFAGDTYNTAVYLARISAQMQLDVEVAYVTGLGDDPYSQQMRQAWVSEGVTDRSVAIAGGRPGLYAVDTDALGERMFTYWREGSAASRLMRQSWWIASLEASHVHFSGVTLQLMSPTSREDFVARLGQLREQGTTVSLDTNYRPTGWPDPKTARAAFTEAAGQADIIFAGVEDETLLGGRPPVPAEIADRYLALGVREVLAKAGDQGCLVATPDHRRHVPAVSVAHVVDTTAAGDSFAGGYLAARLGGRRPASAATVASAVAAAVVALPGAIAPRGFSLLSESLLRMEETTPEEAHGVGRLVRPG